MQTFALVESTGISAAMPTRVWHGIRLIGEYGPTPTVIRLLVTGFVYKKHAKRHELLTNFLTEFRVGRSWLRSPGSSKCLQVKPTSQQKIRLAKWAITSSAKATSGRSE